MENTYLHRVLNVFREEDWKACKDYLASPFFGQSTFHIKLFGFLYTNRSRIKQGDLAYFTRERLFDKTFHPQKASRPITKKQYQALRRKQSALLQQIKNFLYLKTQLQQANTQILAEVQTWRQRNDQGWFQDTIDVHLEQFMQSDCPSQADLALAYRLNEELFLYGYTPRSKKQSGKVETLYAMVLAAEQWYVLAGLRGFVELVVRMTTYDEHNLAGRESQLVYLLQQSSAHQASIPLIGLYANILRMQLSRLTEKVEKDLGLWALAPEHNLEETIRLFKTCADQLEQYEKHALIGWMANLADWVYKMGHEGAAAVVLRIYNLGHDHACLALGDFIQPLLLINYCSYAALGGKPTLVDDLIQYYEPMLPEKDRQPAILICRAFTLFFQEDYEAVFDLLLHAKGGSHLYQLIMYGLELRSLYYLEQIQADHYWLDRLERQCKNFKRYLERTRTIDAFKRQCYLNFTDRLKDLLRLRYANYGQDISTGAHSVRETIRQEPTALPFWLNKQVDHLLQALGKD